MKPLIRRSFRRSTCAALAVFSVAALGCFGSDLGATVSGTVTLDGAPVGPGVVTFAPASDSTLPAEGQLQADGSYYLETSKQRGLTPGSYRVAVQAFQPPEGLGRGERSYEPSKRLVPEKYMKITTSELQFQVEPGHNAINIPLHSQ